MKRQDRPRNMQEIIPFLLCVEPAIYQHLIAGLCALRLYIDEIKDDLLEEFCRQTGASANILEETKVIHEVLLKLIDEVNNLKWPIELVIYRTYGMPKISKPKELKGLKPVFSLVFRKHKNQVFFLEGDVYVYFYDLFSKAHRFPDAEDAGLSIPALSRKYPDVIKNRSMKFIYADNWSTILDRNEG